MRKNGAYTCLVTGGFTLFAQQIGKMIGFDEMRANRLKLDPDGHLSGLVEEPMFGRDAKRATLVELRERLGLAREDTMATGDGANDLDMIAEAGLGVAFHAKPTLAETAAARIDHNDLTALLYVQGYKRDEFARSLVEVQRDKGGVAVRVCDQQDGVLFAFLAQLLDTILQLGRRVDRLLLNRDDHRARNQPLFGGGRVGVDRGNDHALDVRLDAETAAHFVIEVRELETQRLSAGASLRRLLRLVLFRRPPPASHYLPGARA